MNYKNCCYVCFCVKDVNLQIKVGCFRLSFEILYGDISMNTINKYLQNKKNAILIEKRLDPKNFVVSEISEKEYKENYWWMH